MPQMAMPPIQAMPQMAIQQTVPQMAMFQATPGTQAIPSTGSVSAPVQVSQQQGPPKQAIHQNVHTEQTSQPNLTRAQPGRAQLRQSPSATYSGQLAMSESRPSPLQGNPSIQQYRAPPQPGQPQPLQVPRHPNQLLNPSNRPPFPNLSAPLPNHPP